MTYFGSDPAHPPAALSQGVGPARGAGGPRLETWERWSEWPLAVLAVVFLLAYSFDVLDTDLTSGWHAACRAIDYVVWLLFVVDYATRLLLADERLRYWWRHLPDLAVVALPVLRPLRLLRLVMLLRVLNRRAAHALHGRVIFYVWGAALILVYCAALAVLDAERHHDGANIASFGDALWWAAETVSTVGYGEHYPVTTEGRFVAVGLMIGGIALIGAVSASFATWLIERVRQVEDASQLTTRRDLMALHQQLDRIERRLTNQADGSDSAAAPRPSDDQDRV